ncbi:MAG: spore coat associated protein CotJA [Peptococcaceae bacterium]|jgi:hypothetical protein|nr:spore coat associated protein CotJA [Peptococcaceae bacterium]
MMMQKTERLGMISVPWQTYSAPLPPADALCAGTVFRELVQPYTPVSCNQPVMQPMQNMAAMLGMQKKR